MQKPVKYKILVSAYACSPRYGSEPGMGWNFVKGISQYHEIHVITELKWREDLENEKVLKQDLGGRVTFHYIKKKRNRRLRKLWPPSYYWFYRQWQKKVYNLAKRLDLQEDFDIFHQLNMVGYREPGYLWKLGKPFVWGPIGGMGNTSFKLLLNMRPGGIIYYSARSIINQLQKLIAIRPRKAAQRNNNALIAATPHVKREIRKHWNKNSIVIPEVGQEIVFSRMKINIRKDFEPLRIVWTGDHTNGKALNILLKSLSKLNPKVKWKLIVLGSGPYTKKWKLQSERLKINSGCEWNSWLSKEEAHEKMLSSHVLCITSLKDLTSTVLMEGLSFALPIICIDHCGFSNVVNETCGVKIAIDYPTKLILGFKDAIERIYFNESLRIQLANGAYKRASDFIWNDKITQVNKLYSSFD